MKHTSYQQKLLEKIEGYPLNGLRTEFKICAKDIIANCSEGEIKDIIETMDRLEMRPLEDKIAFLLENTTTSERKLSLIYCLETHVIEKWETPPKPDNRYADGVRIKFELPQGPRVTERLTPPETVKIIDKNFNVNPNDYDTKSPEYIKCAVILLHRAVMEKEAGTANLDIIANPEISNVIINVAKNPYLENSDYKEILFYDIRILIGVKKDDFELSRAVDTVKILKEFSLLNAEREYLFNRPAALDRALDNKFPNARFIVRALSGENYNREEIGKFFDEDSLVEFFGSEDVADKQKLRDEWEKYCKTIDEIIDKMIEHKDLQLIDMTIDRTKTTELREGLLARRHEVVDSLEKTSQDEPSGEKTPESRQDDDESSDNAE